MSVCAVAVTNKSYSLSSVYCTFPDLFSLGHHFWLLHKPQWELKSIQHIFFSSQELNLKLYKNTTTKTQGSDIFTTTIRIWEPAKKTEVSLISNAAQLTSKVATTSYKLDKTNVSLIRCKSNLRWPPCVRIYCNSVKLPVWLCAHSGATEKKTHAGTVGGGVPIKPNSFLYWLPPLKE